jgi:hypothetical protein
MSPHTTEVERDSFRIRTRQIAALRRSTAYGATLSLADALSKVPSRPDLPTFVIAARLIGRHRPVRWVAPAIVGDVQ